MAKPADQRLRRPHGEEAYGYIPWVLPASRDAILERLADDDLVLDVGGWAKPFSRADWVLDLMPYDTRGLYGYDEGSHEHERFTADTWVQRDICAREPWPFGDDQFDFAVCSHTLEDVRDPIRVCQELARVAKAGYVEVPSRLEEQSFGIQGPWTGWGHHHWLVERAGDARLRFVFKHHVLHGREDFRFSAGFHASLTPEQRVVRLFWEGTVEAEEYVLVGADQLDDYLRGPVAGHEHASAGGLGRSKRLRRWASG